MIELELLGLTDGQKLSLNDSEGNRYVLPITDELRAALRTDINQGEDSEPRPITPREIQAHFRAGLSVADVSEISSLPPSQLNGLAYPIFAEREYTAQLARSDSANLKNRLKKIESRFLKTILRQSGVFRVRRIKFLVQQE